MLLSQQIPQCARTHPFLQMRLTDKLRDEIQANMHGRNASHGHRQQFGSITLKTNSEISPSDCWWSNGTQVNNITWKWTSLARVGSAINIWCNRMHTKHWISLRSLSKDADSCVGNKSRKWHKSWAWTWWVTHYWERPSHPSLEGRLPGASVWLHCPGQQSVHSSILPAQHGCSKGSDQGEVQQPQQVQQAHCSLAAVSTNQGNIRM